MALKGIPEISCCSHLFSTSSLGVEIFQDEELLVFSVIINSVRLYKYMRIMAVSQ